MDRRHTALSYSERFPASTKVTIAVGHDPYFNKLEVSYETVMIPLFIKLNERDKITYPLDEVADDQVAEWVESRLLDFVDAYLRIDRGRPDFDDEAATDPVCGMRIQRSAAVGSENYRGHPYFFCSPECQRAFAQSPEAYVDAKGF
jgi:YHS domain-containing protein